MRNLLQGASRQMEAKAGARPEKRRNPLQPLAAMRDRGSMPRSCEICLGLGLPLNRRNSLTILFDELPGEAECTAVAGLDVVLCFRGYFTRYGILRRMCDSLLAGRPRRLLVVDLDLKKTAFLKLAEALVDHA
jgi:hypothetical protein